MLVSELEAKYTGQVSKKLIDALADRLSVRVEKEEDIKGIIDELEKSPVRIADIQAESDRRATELTHRIKELEKQKGETAPPASPPEPKQGESKDEFLSRLEKIEKLIEDNLKREQKQKAMEVFHSRVESLKIPKAMYESVQVDTIDQVDDHVKQLDERYKELVKQIKGPEPTEPPKKGDPAAARQRIIDDIRKFSKTI
jgi:DNA repair exonuclease SbcCD ATPase subunit